MLNADRVLRNSITWNDMRENDMRENSSVLLPLALKRTPQRAQGSKPGYGSAARLEQ